MKLRRRITLGFGVIVALAAVAVLRPYPSTRYAPDEDAPTLVVDRNGAILRKVTSQTGRREAWLPLADVPPIATLSLLASEDERFFAHGGVDPIGVARAAWLDVRAGRMAYGASTLSMQLASLLDPSLHKHQLVPKLVQVVDALRLERTLGKHEIMEQYLNRAGFGRGAVGLEAAAQTYFGTPARALSPGQASLLAVLPRAPSRYDLVTHLPDALARRAHVLDLLVERDLITREQRAAIDAETVEPSLHLAPFRAPHFVDWALSTLAHGQHGVVHTTVDVGLQERLEHDVAEHVDSLSNDGMHQAGVVVLDTASGEVRALVGSAAWSRSQVDIAATRRHPGSALKPFVYATAIEDGANPAAIAVDASDVPSAYRLPEASSNERGPLRYREALSGSYNLAAVHVLEEVGIERLLGKLRAAGLGSFDAAPDEYGLRLALGSARVRLVELAAAYGFLVRGGTILPARGVLRIDGARSTWLAPSLGERRIFSPEASWLVMDMLADESARHHRFGDELPLDLPYRVAAKTGTSRGFADTVAVVTTRELTVAAWGGNFDGAPTEGLVAMQSAAPLARAALLAASDGRALTLPLPPKGLVRREVCALSGHTPGPHCAERKLEWMRADGEVSPCTWHQPDGVHLPPVYVRWQARVGHH